LGQFRIKVLPLSLPFHEWSKNGFSKLKFAGRQGHAHHFTRMEGGKIGIEFA